MLPFDANGAQRASLPRKAGRSSLRRPIAATLAAFVTVATLAIAPASGLSAAPGSSSAAFPSPTSQLTFGAVAPTSSITLGDILAGDRSTTTSSLPGPGSSSPSPLNEPAPTADPSAPPIAPVPDPSVEPSPAPEAPVEPPNLLAHPAVGGVILFSRNDESPGQLARLAAEIHALRSPALLVAVDHEGGRVQRFRDGFTRLPPLRGVGRRHVERPEAGVALARELGWLMAAELRACGVDLSFAPCVDLDYGVSEVIGDRYFHARAESVAELAVAYMLGMREAGMAATAKHFPGHGAVAADSHVALPVDRRGIPDLDPDLVPYRRLIANGLLAVMAAHVVYPEVDRLPASLSRRWIEGELRGTLGFRGAVFTDDLSMKGAAAFGPILERARLALGAGCDMLPVCNDPQAVAVLLDGLEDEPHPLRQVRLLRLHGRGAPPLAELQASQRWRDAAGAAQHCLDVPELRLDA